MKPSDEVKRFCRYAGLMVFGPPLLLAGVIALVRASHHAFVWLGLDLPGANAATFAVLVAWFLAGFVTLIFRAEERRWPWQPERRR